MSPLVASCKYTGKVSREPTAESGALISVSDSGTGYSRSEMTFHSCDDWRFDSQECVREAIADRHRGVG